MTEQKLDSYTRKARDVAREILEAFRTKDVPRALAQVYVASAVDEIPSSKWSPSNRFVVAIHGHAYAATYNQWQKLGRQVQRGEDGFDIIAPITRTARKDDPDRDIEEGDRIVVGFRTRRVFGYGQTKGDPLQEIENRQQFIEELPLFEVARHWGLEVTPFSGRGASVLGLYTGSEIRLGVENLFVWAHELVHAADHRNGTLDDRPTLEDEVVADFGGSVLLEVIGRPLESDRGGAYEHLCRHAKKHDVEPIRVVAQLFDRVFGCLDLILTTAEELGCKELSSAAT